MSKPLHICRSKYTILHIHNERMLKLLYNINDVSVMDSIKYIGMIGKKVFVFDVFRTEIEQKQSLFFENIDTFHFIVPFSILNKYDINILINRFNNIFHETIISDHFKTIYNIECPEEFDHVNKYLMIEKDNVKFIKLRLKDSKIWSKIIGNIMHENIALMTDYQTSSKDCKDLYNSFKSLYFIPNNILEHIEKSNALNIVGIHQKINVQETDIQLMKGDFKKQIIVLKNYIKELENKIEKMNNREVLFAKKVENIDNIEKNDKVDIEVTKEINNITKSQFNQNNITLQIVES